MNRQTLFDNTGSNRSSQRLLVQADGLVRSGPNRPLIDQASCQIFAGDQIALTGSSGSGKSLLLRSLALLDEVEQGTIRWQGNAVKPHNIPRFRSHVIYVHQQASLTEGTVEDALREPFFLRVNKDKTYSSLQVEVLLNGLQRTEDFLSKQIADLSGGEAQLTALLRAILLQPHVLLLDEPTSALDPETAAAAESLVLNWFAEKPDDRAFVWVTHQRQQADRIANVQWQVSEGKLQVSR